MYSTELQSIVTALETAFGAQSSANPSEAGLWKRAAVAAEGLAGIASTGSDSIHGYMKRTAVALEDLTGTSGAEEADSVPGLMKRIVDALEVQAGSSVGTLERRMITAAGAAPFNYALLLDFEDSVYWKNGTVYSDITAVPGYAYSRANAKRELNASGSALVSFNANVPGIVPDKGFWSRPTLTNHIIYSTQLDQTGGANWTAVAVAVTADQAVAPDGTTTMDKVTMNGVNQAHLIYPETGRTHPDPFTDSIFMRYDGSHRYWNIINGVNGDEFATFDLLLGVCKTSNAAIVEPYMVDMGGGLWRLVAVWHVAGTGDTCVMVAAPSYDTVRVPAFASSAYGLMWGAQSIDGDFPDGGPFIPTVGTTVALGADALAFTVDNGDYSAQYIFADGSTDEALVSVADGTFEVVTSYEKAIARLRLEGI